MRLALQLSHRALAELLAVGLRTQAGVERVDVLPSRGSLRSALRQSRARIFVMDGVSPGPAMLAEHLRQLRDVRPAAPTLLLARADRELLRTALQFGVNGIVDADASLESLMAALQQLAAGHSWLPAEVIGDLVGSARTGHTGSPLEGLSPRQRQVLDLIGNGMTVREIATVLGVGTKTVETHRARLMQSLGLKRANDLVIFAVQNHGGNHGR